MIESALAEGDGKTALAALDEHADAPLLQRPKLLRGLALQLTGDPSADESLHAALSDAGDDDPFGRALALVALGRRTDAEPILDDLGVVALPRWLTEPGGR